MCLQKVSRYISRNSYTWIIAKETNKTNINHTSPQEMFLSVRARQTLLSELIGCCFEFSLNFQTSWFVFSDFADVEKLKAERQFLSLWPTAVSRDKERGWLDKTGQSLPKERCKLPLWVSRVNGFIISCRLRIVGWPGSWKHLSRKFYRWLKAADSWQLYPLTVITSVGVKSIM